MERCRSSVGHNAIFVDRLSPSVAAKRHIVSDDCGVISALIDTPSGGFPRYPNSRGFSLVGSCFYLVWTYIYSNDYYMIPFHVHLLALRHSEWPWFSSAIIRCHIGSIGNFILQRVTHCALVCFRCFSLTYNLEVDWYEL